MIVETMERVKNTSVCLIDGKATAAAISNEIKEEVDAIRNSGGKIPHLVAVLVGNNGASESYVRNKMRTCEAVGFKSTLIRKETSITEHELIAIVKSLNADNDVDGFIVQLPLPDHISVDTITEAILPAKDVDGFHPVNIGRMSQGLPSYLPATPKGILQLLQRYNIETSGKHCVVLGRSNIVGTPMSILLSRNSDPGNCTVTMCHSRTKNISEYTLQADIIIAAIGQPGFVKAEMVKEGAVVIDVGMVRVPSEKTKSGFKLCGDVDFENVAPKCSYITPVPGGVGPMTVIGLVQNTLLAAKKAIYK
jgi:methylenetetrahydrofolate dehydrogenase (NADP+)/methenyltetrahydrofolate cyclohydrolase